MEELSEGIVKGALRLVGLVVRCLIWLMWEVCFEVIGWLVGWVVCRIISLGQYPKEPLTEYEASSPLTHFIVSLIGCIALVLTATVIAKLVGSG